MSGMNTAVVECSLCLFACFLGIFEESAHFLLFSVLRAFLNRDSRHVSMCACVQWVVLTPYSDSSSLKHSHSHGFAPQRYRLFSNHTSKSNFTAALSGGSFVLISAFFHSFAFGAIISATLTTSYALLHWSVKELHFPSFTDAVPHPHAALRDRTERPELVNEPTNRTSPSFRPYVLPNSNFTLRAAPVGLSVLNVICSYL